MQPTGCESNGVKVPCRQLPDSDGKHIRRVRRQQLIRCSEVNATAALRSSTAAVGTTWVASKPGGLNIKE
jgi:hypothetical protein